LGRKERVEDSTFEAGGRTRAGYRKGYVPEGYRPRECCNNHGTEGGKRVVGKREGEGAVPMCEKIFQRGEGEGNGKLEVFQMGESQTVREGTDFLPQICV